jgi:hypothetical protein
MLHALGLREVAKVVHPVDDDDDTQDASASQYFRNDLRNYLNRKSI